MGIELYWFLLGALVCGAGHGLIYYLRHSTRARARQKAESILRSHGLETCDYWMGTTSLDPALQHALDQVAELGRVIIDSEGRVVGTLVPRLVRHGTPPPIRLVVDNTEQPPDKTVSTVDRLP